jgi:hypothetical protein
MMYHDRAVEGDGDPIIVSKLPEVFMAWIEHWKAIAARIEGLIRSGEYVVSALQRNDGDTFGIVRHWIAPELERITGELRAFLKASQAELPPAAVEALDRFLGQDWFTKQPELINTTWFQSPQLRRFVQSSSI